MGTPSHPPTFTTVARALGATRLNCWTPSQLSILDTAIDAICRDLEELNPRFDAERFKTTARYRQFRAD